MQFRILETPTGPFALMVNDGQIATSWMTAALSRRLRSARPSARLLPDLARRLGLYFKGKQVDFDDVPTPEGSEFFRGCWDACRRIPRGQTRSYAQLAAMAGGNASAARAAGQSMRRNPLPVVVPCHRVIATGGSLHGFGGSCDSASRELHVKSTLLAMEGALSATQRRPRRNGSQRVLEFAAS